MGKKIVITETQLKRIVKDMKLNEGQGFNMFKHDTKELWNDDENMDTLKDKWNDLCNVGGNYDEYIRSGRNGNAYYGEDDEWYNRDGQPTDKECDGNVRNNRLNGGIDGKLGRRLGMMGVQAQIPLRMAAEPIYNIRRNIKAAMSEGLDREFGQRLKDTLNVDDETNLRNRITWHGLYHFPEFCEESGIRISDRDIERCERNDERMLEKIMDGKFGKDAAVGFLDYLENIRKDNKPSSSVMKYVRDLNNDWVIHFSFDAENIWMNGFRNASKDVEELGFSKGLDDEGFNFGYCVDRGPEQYFTKRTTAPNYGDAAILFQVNGVEIYHDYDEEYQAVFYNNDAKNLILIEPMDDYGWCIRSNRGGRILYWNDDIQNVIGWAIRNFRQYGTQMVNPKESGIRKNAMMNGFYGTVNESLNNYDIPLYHNTTLDSLLSMMGSNSMKSDYHRGYGSEGTHNGICFTREKTYDPYSDQVLMVFDCQELLKNVRGARLIPYQDDYFHGLDEFEERLVSNNEKGFEIRNLNNVISKVMIKMDVVWRDIDFKNVSLDYEISLLGKIIENNIFGRKLVFVDSVRNGNEMTYEEACDFLRQKYEMKDYDRFQRLYCMETFDERTNQYKPYRYGKNLDILLDVARFEVYELKKPLMVTKGILHRDFYMRKEIIEKFDYEK